jgi:hypothetical protein
MLGDTQLTDVAANRGGHVPPKKKKKKKHKRNRNKSLPHNSSADCGVNITHAILQNDAMYRYL